MLKPTHLPCNPPLYETPDQAIKLFGKTIPLLSQNEASVTVRNDCSVSVGAASELLSDHNSVSPIGSEQDRAGEQQGCNKKSSGGEFSDGKQEVSAPHRIPEDSKDPTTSSGISENPKTPPVDKETPPLQTSKNGEQSESSNSQEKTLKKPDKILPCPRCNSMDTKFCYYNNYNVNQPRHFCKNCQRYWTAGGTMRNVPVGAGRRKNKTSSTSHYRQIMVSEALQAARANAAALANNGTVLTFGSDAPLCESMASVLKLAGKTQNCILNGFQQSEQRIPICSARGESGDDHSSGSCTTATNSTEKAGDASLEKPLTKNFQGLPPQVPCFPGPPWPYPWNPPMPLPALCSSGFPVSFHPAPTYWGCTLPSSWNIPWILPPASSPNHDAVSSGHPAPTLGKHSRDGSIINPANSEKKESSEINVWAPKTLRIDNPSEAAKSSIWETLGIRDEKIDSTSGGGLFKAFQLRAGEKKNHIPKTSPVLQANPAALTRSLNFHECT